jgi:hypothetical protein
MKDFKILCHIASAHHAHDTIILHQPIMHTTPSYCISPSCTPHRHIVSAHHAHHTVILYQPIMHTTPSYCISPSCTPHRHIVSAHHAHHTRLLLRHKYRETISDIGADNFNYICGDVMFARQRKLSPR